MSAAGDVAEAIDSTARDFTIEMRGHVFDCQDINSVFSNNIDVFAGR